jgi:hypothetical protein
VLVHAAEQGTLLFLSNSSGIKIGVKVGFGVVVCRHLMPLAAFFMKTNPSATPLDVVVSHFHRDDSADTFIKSWRTMRR